MKWLFSVFEYVLMTNPMVRREISRLTLYLGYDSLQQSKRYMVLI